MQAEKNRRFVNKHTPSPYAGDDVSEFIEREMVIPETGQPMELHSEQRLVLQAMCHKTDGKFDYSTWLYSAPKKSAKTTIGASVALWQAWCIPDGNVYIIGNDQRQADNRMAQAIRYAVTHNPRFKNRARIIQNTIILENGTKIESIPVDPRGEAGMNPTGLFWTEAWGAIGNKPGLLWTEAALSPTRVGQSFKFIESYAGFRDESIILERLYESIVKNGKVHEVIPEVYTRGGSIAYWCTRRYLPWQVNNPQYYADEENDKVPAEFNRLHNNQWADATQAFIPIEWWRACRTEYTAEPNESMIIGVDAATTNDHFAVVMVSKRGEHVYVHYVQVWKPPQGGEIDYSEPEKEIRRLINTYNVIELSYDATQLVSMVQRLRNEEFVNARSFSQGNDRLIADKRLYDMIRSRTVHHSGEPDLAEHMSNAAAEIDKHESRLRIVKRTSDKHIDSVIALSMATDRSFSYAW